MIKKFLLSSFILLSLHSFAQEGTASPYSFYGIGNIKFQGTVENKSMGGLGILPDSIHVNLQNPASLSALKLTSFGVAGTYNKESLNSASSSEKARRTSLDYLVMAFPLRKVGLSLGIMPYSSVGYKLEKIEADGTGSRYSGTGGVNKVFVGAGYQITPKLSVGADFAYNFGKIEANSTAFISNAQYGSRELNTNEYSGVTFNAGLMYKTKFKKYDLVSSLTLSPSTSLNSTNQRNLAVITYSSSGLERVWDSQDILVGDSKIKLPTKLSFGAGIGEIKKWFVGFESTFQGKSDFGNKYASNVSFENATKFSLGGYYTPNYNSFSNYFNKVTYRAGLRSESTGLVINNQSINDSAVTLGLGLPVGGAFSNINLGLEYGKRGTTNAGLIRENYLNISIGMSFNDKWFVKRKFD
ncbi:MAG: outer membrane beta-barrel protein [Flavobacterium sp.]|uniref:outer membrane beta-barrel protein n=1 Tax=Flavobacterium sp. TaxID=239 RepID=UPI003265CE10